MKAKCKAMCCGCRDNYYNGQGAKECWSYADATVVVRQRVGVWQPPPYAWHPEHVLNCYRPEGYVMLKHEDCRMKHNWKGARVAQ